MTGRIVPAYVSFNFDYARGDRSSRRAVDDVFPEEVGGYFQRRTAVERARQFAVLHSAKSGVETAPGQERILGLLSAYGRPGAVPGIARYAVRQFQQFGLDGIEQRVQ